MPGLRLPRPSAGASVGRRRRVIRDMPIMWLRVWNLGRRPGLHVSVLADRMGRAGHALGVSSRRAATPMGCSISARRHRYRRGSGITRVRATICGYLHVSLAGGQYLTRADPSATCPKANGLSTVNFGRVRALEVGEAFVEVGDDPVEGHAFLLHRVAFADRNRLVLQGVEVDGDAVRRADLVLAAIASSDG